MDAGTADTLNRRFADEFACYLDAIDTELGFRMKPWHNSPIAATLMGENATSDADRAWLVGALISKCPDLDIDSHPADADWENLFTHIRAAILARRDPESPHARTAETRPGVVV